MNAMSQATESRPVARYVLGVDKSRFSVHATAAGFLAFAGHSPTFEVRKFTGVLEFDKGTVSRMRLRLTIEAESLELVSQASPTDRRDIETRMRTEVLETRSCPQIQFEADNLAAREMSRDNYQLRIDGRLALHGAVNRQPVDARLTVDGKRVRLTGDSVVRLSDYRIRPVTALAGTLRLKDEIEVTFDIAGREEATP